MSSRIRLGLSELLCCLGGNEGSGEKEGDNGQSLVGDEALCYREGWSN